MWRWVLMLIILLCLVCLWVSWRADWFPFGASLLNQPTKQDTLNSLTATGTPSTTLNELTPALVKGTATGTSSATVTAPVDTNAILDSLTPKK